MILADFTTIAILKTFLVFCRVGTLFMFIPAISDATVSVNIRLILAIMVSIALTASVEESFMQLNVELTSSPLLLFLLIIQELATGLSLGIIVRTILTAIHIAGITIASQLGLAAAMLFDPSQQTQGSVVGNIFSLLAVILLLLSNTHLMILEGVVHSYKVIPFYTITEFYPSLLDTIITVLNGAWEAGVKIAAPFIILTTILMLGVGILSKLMPQLQIFFLTLPAQILVGVVLLATTISAIGVWFVEYYQEVLCRVFGL
ncbi:Flagellar biosynthetic protein FliR [Alphaproteobacteria bacterium]